MFGREVLQSEDRVPAWLWAVAAVAGASAVAYGVLRLVRSRRPEGIPSELDLLEESAVERLRTDAVTGRAAIDVAALAPGIIELTGVVTTHEAGQRAARLLHALPGVHTVINRLETRSEEQQLAANRARRAARTTSTAGVGADNDGMSAATAEGDVETA